MRQGSTNYLNYLDCTNKRKKHKSSEKKFTANLSASKIGKILNCTDKYIVKIIIIKST